MMEMLAQMQREIGELKEQQRQEHRNEEKTHSRDKGADKKNVSFWDARESANWDARDSANKDARDSANKRHKSSVNESPSFDKAKDKGWTTISNKGGKKIISRGGSGGSGEQQICHEFKKSGDCKRGDKCRFKHAHDTATTTTKKHAPRSMVVTTKRDESTASIVTDKKNTLASKLLVKTKPPSLQDYIEGLRKVFPPALIFDIAYGVLKCVAHKVKNGLEITTDEEVHTTHFSKYVQKPFALSPFGLAPAFFLDDNITSLPVGSLRKVLRGLLKLPKSTVTAEDGMTGDTFDNYLGGMFAGLDVSQWIEPLLCFGEFILKASYLLYAPQEQQYKDVADTPTSFRIMTLFDDVHRCPFVLRFNVAAVAAEGFIPPAELHSKLCIPVSPLTRMMVAEVVAENDFAPRNAGKNQ